MQSSGTNSGKRGSREIVSPSDIPCNAVLVDSDWYTDEDSDSELFEDDVQPLSLVKEKSSIKEGEINAEGHEESVIFYKIKRMKFLRIQRSLEIN